ncbi:hypothetical protein [Streptomyces sp. NPDC048825]|uniref:hypothetical protein n=1 Tax=Streptomyces sp. NPDC048825 TaxID=3365592 RepID=UPI00372409B8
MTTAGTEEHLSVYRLLPSMRESELPTGDPSSPVLSHRVADLLRGLLAGRLDTRLVWSETPGPFRIPTPGGSDVNNARESAFRDHMRRGAERVLYGFPEVLRPEIYVVSFEVWRVDQDPRYPYAAIGYNTESAVRRVLDQGCAYEGSARWEYSYWSLEGFERLGHVPEDPVGSSLHLAEAQAEELWYEDEGGLSDEACDARDDQLVRRFDELCIDVARRLRADGHIARVFGRAVPIVLFDMDRPSWETEATEAANPREVLADFLEHHSVR